MFYTFHQNNSGGGFTHREVDGIGYMVVVEANDKDHAISRAQDIGLYFDGYGDCECCGNRWSTYIEGTEVPTSYGAALVLDDTGEKNWGLYSYVHYLDGRVLRISGDTAQPLY